MSKIQIEIENINGKCGGCDLQYFHKDYCKMFCKFFDEKLILERDETGLKWVALRCQQCLDAEVKEAANGQ